MSKNFYKSLSVLLLAVFGLATAQSAFAQEGEKAEKKADAEATTDAPKAEEAPKVESPYKTLAERIAYFVGYQTGSQIPKNELKIDLDMTALTAGFKDAIDGNKSVLGDNAGRTIFQEYIVFRKEAADKYMTGLNEKKGLTKTESGMMYEVIKKGDGDTSPKATDKVKVHYAGTLTDGSEFDSSIKRGQPAEFPVNGVIAGWTEALQLMKKGDKWRLYIPPALGYGERGSSPKIGPNEVLIFEVELLEITPAG